MQQSETKPRGPIISEAHPRSSGYNCNRCQKIIPLQWDSAKDEHPDQTDNDLSLEFHGGYGQFTDCIYDCPADTIRLCHECAHDLCDWLGLDPSTWHTHSAESGQHPDHHRGPNSNGQQEEQEDQR